MGFNAALRQVGPIPKRFILLALIAVGLGLGGWVLWGVALPKGLPRGLIEKQRQLTELSLPRSVDRLDWVADTIKILNASGTKIRSLRGLPASLRELDVSNTKIQSLASVPRGLKSLDIREARIEHLVGLPPHLVSLKVGNRKIFRLGRIPDSLQELYLENTSISALTGLPSHLRSLYIEGKSVENLDGLPETLKSLTLVNTNVKTLKNLPPSLQVLKLKNNIHLRFQASDLPPLLTSLEIDLDQPSPDLSGLKYLTWFSDRRELSSPPPLPSFLSSLTLRKPGWTELPKLPRSLRALGLLSA